MIQNKDFIEIEYTGRIKDENIIFDTTDAILAKENSLPAENCGSVIICVGESQILKGLDENLMNKEVGREYDIILQPEQAFGKRTAKLIRLIPTSKFKGNDIAPHPGMQVNIDGVIGVIKTVSGGRTLVDLNHPLAGRILQYKVKIIRKVDDAKEMLIGYLKLTLGIKVDAEFQEGKAVVELKNPAMVYVCKELSGKIKELIPAIKELEFKAEEKKAETSGKNKKEIVAEEQLLQNKEINK